MPRPLKFPTKVLIGFDDDRLKAIDAWRRKQEKIPSRSEAIRRLVDQALAAGRTIPVIRESDPAPAPRKR